MQIIPQKENLTSNSPHSIRDAFIAFLKSFLSMSRDTSRVYHSDEGKTHSVMMLFDVHTLINHISHSRMGVGKCTVHSRVTTTKLHSSRALGGLDHHI